MRCLASQPRRRPQYDSETKTRTDIYLNDVACWRNVPAKVWSYTIGGYQVIKKWLSYRERALLGRALTADEAREVMNIARRIAAILLLEPALDATTKPSNNRPTPGLLDKMVRQEMRRVWEVIAMHSPLIVSSQAVHTLAQMFLSIQLSAVALHLHATSLHAPRPQLGITQIFQSSHST